MFKRVLPSGGAVSSTDVAVALGFLLMGIVRIEPAPVDGVMAIVIAVALVTGRFDLRSAPLWASGLVGVFLFFNLLSCIEAVKPGRAAQFLAITVYLCMLGLWTAGYVRTGRRARLEPRRPDRLSRLHRRARRPRDGRRAPG